jgi:RHS repeat-associated protein
MDNFKEPVQDIGSVQGQSVARDINSSGVVVGNDAPGSWPVADPNYVRARGFRWTEAEGMIDIPAESPSMGVFPMSINDVGVGEVAGAYVTTPPPYWQLHAARAAGIPNAPFVELTGLGIAASINNRSQIAGTYLSGGGMFVANSDNTIVSLPMPSGINWGTATGIGPGGDVVGFGQNNDDDNVALVANDLGTFVMDNPSNEAVGGGVWQLTEAYASNDTGIVGTGWHDDSPRAFLFEWGNPHNRVTDLGLPPDLAEGVGGSAVAYDLNASKEIVGAIYGNNQNTAFAWVPGQGMIDLNTLIDPLSGWHLDVAYAINDSGYVVGYGHHDGQARAFKMRLPGLLPCDQGQNPVCHGPIVRDLITRECPAAGPADDALACDDGDSCTKGDGCRQGACQAGTEDKVCSQLAAITPKATVVRLSDGTLRAVFSYHSTGTQNVNIPYGDQNYISKEFVRTNTPKVAPPIWFAPGSHKSFVTTFETEHISWTLGDRMVTASASAPAVAEADVRPEGEGIAIDGEFLTVKEDPAFRLQGSVVAADQTADGPATGVVAGRLDVSADGASTYHLPIWTPWAPLQPELSLDYNSRGGNSYIGMGFHLSGVGEISRCRATYAQSSPITPANSINLTNDDHLCLNGRILIPVDGTPWTNSAEYRPENDPFTRVVERNDEEGAKSFEVSRKDGLKEVYGDTDDSILTGLDPSPGRAAPPATPPRFSWGISKKVDRVGNAIKYSYYKRRGENDVGSERIPLLIQYGNVDGANMPFKIWMTIDTAHPRPDSTFRYEAGYRFESTRLITAIDVQGPNPIVISSIRHYDLSYTRPSISSRSLLSSIGECDGNGTVCKAPTTFAWQAGAFSFTESSVSIPEIHPYIGNLNPPLGRKYYFLTVGDVDGDGKDDLIYRGQSGPKVALFYRLSMGNGFGDAVEIVGSAIDPHNDLPDVENPPLMVKSVLTTDLNRDGRVDLIVGNRVLTPADGATFELPTRVNGVGDIDGDGLPDLVDSWTRWAILPTRTPKAFDNVATVRFNKLATNPAAAIDGLFGAVDYTSPYYGTGRFLAPSLLDLNGDDALDLVEDDRALSPLTGGAAWLNGTGLGFQGLRPQLCSSSYPETITSIVDQNACFAGAVSNLPIDINGDGRPDMVEFVSLTVDQWANKCPGFPECLLHGICSSCEELNWIRIQPAVFMNTGSRFSASDLSNEEIPTAAPWSFSPSVRDKGNPSLAYFGYTSWRREMTKDECTRYVSSSKAICGVDVEVPQVLVHLGLYPDESTPDRFFATTDPGVRVADLNGDGQSDLIMFGQMAVGKHRRDKPQKLKQAMVFLGDGDTFRAPVAIPTSTVPLPDDEHITIPPGGLLIGRSVVLLPDFEITPNDVEPYALTRVLDVNGDGLPDFISAFGEKEGQQPVVKLFLHNGDQPDLLKSVKNGRGLEDSVDYVSMSESALDDTATYKRNQPGTCTFPEECVDRGMWLVSTLSRDNPHDANPAPPTRFKYHYRQGRADAQGAGWLGFLSVSIENTSTDEVIEKTYAFERQVVDGRVGYLGTGTPQTVTDTQPLAEGKTLKNIETSQYSWAVVPIAGSRNASIGEPRLVKTTKEAHDTTAGGQIQLKTRRTLEVPANQYDDYGNPKSSEEKVEQADEQGNVTTIEEAKTTRTFQNLTGTWLLGLKESETVERIVPDLYGDGQDQVTQKLGFTYKPGTNLLATTTRDPDGGADTYLVTTLERDNPHGLITRMIKQDKIGNRRIVDTTFDAVVGLYPEVTTQNGLSSRTTYHPSLGLVVRQEDANGLGASFVYDSFGRTKQVAKDGAEVTDYLYGGTPASEVLEIYSSGQPIQAVTHDRLGREVLRRTEKFDASDGARWNRTVTNYNYLGLVSGKSIVESEAPADLMFCKFPPEILPVDADTMLHDETWKYTTYNYDKAGRLTSTQLPGAPASCFHLQDSGGGPSTGDRIIPASHGGFTKRDYQWLNVVDTIKLEQFDTIAETIRTLTYDGNGNVVSNVVKDPKTGHLNTTSFRYGALGLQRKTIDPGKNESTVVYDAWGRRTHLGDPSMGSTDTTYSGFDDVVTSTTPKGTRTHFVDAMGRSTGETGPDGTVTVTWDLAANGLGKESARTSPDGVVLEMKYDAFGRPSESAWTVPGEAQPMAITRDYDQFGRLSTIAYPATGNYQLQAIQGYNSTGYLSEVLSADTDGLQHVWDVEGRSASGQLARERFGNGSVGVRTYQPNGNLKKIRTSSTADAVGPAVQDQPYVYDTLGRVKVRGNNAYTYDYLNRLKTWTHDPERWQSKWTETYDYADVGNLTSVSTTSPQGTIVHTDTFGFGERGYGPHAMTSGPSGQYDYDAVGNQTGAPGRTIGFTTDGLPRTIVKDGVTTSFKYDGLGQRVIKDSPSGGRTLTLGGLYEKRTVGSFTTHVFYLGPGGTPVAQITVDDLGGSKQSLYLHTDHLGSPVAITDEVGDQAGESVDFDPWGRRVTFDLDGRPALSQSTPQSRIGFTGHEEDLELDLINMLGRIYDPQQRRFISPDPLVSHPFSGQSYNRYSYVLNNPLNLIDPTGYADDEPIESNADDLMSRAPPTAPPTAKQDENPNPTGGRARTGVQQTDTLSSSGVSDQSGPDQNSAQRDLLLERGKKISRENSWGSEAHLRALQHYREDWVRYLRSKGDLAGAAVNQYLANVFRQVADEGGLYAFAGARVIRGALGNRSMLRQLAPSNPTPTTEGDGAGFLAGADGTAVHRSQAEMIESIESVGAQRVGPTTNTTEAGTIYRMDTPGGPMEVRVMEGRAGGTTLQDARTVVTRPGTKEYVNPNGSRIRGAVPLGTRRQTGHIHGQTP